jgi:homoprotocatechuate degradation regulator HpaR
LPRRPKAPPHRANGVVVPVMGPPLPLQLLRAREAVMQLFRPHLRTLGLTDQQGRILRVLAEVRAMEMRELSARTCILPASLSRMVPRMHARGIVRRSKDRADGRRVMVAITRRGLVLLRAISRQSVEIYAAVAKEIGASEMRDLHRSLDTLIAKIGTAAH